MRLSAIVGIGIVFASAVFAEEATVSVRFDAAFRETTLRVEAPDSIATPMRAMKAFPTVPPGASLVVMNRGEAKQRVGIYYPDCNLESRDLDGKAGCAYIASTDAPIIFKVSGDRDKLRQFRAELQSGNGKAIPLTLGELGPDATVAIELSADQLSPKGDNRIVLVPAPSKLVDVKTALAKEAAPAADGPTAPTL